MTFLNGGTATTELVRGQSFGDYEIQSIAGKGGMGVVYRATQRSLGRTVALKVVRDEIAQGPEYRERFLREARLAASVDHPHVVTVYDVGEQDGQLFLAMQWIDGEDLKQVLERSGRLAPERVVAIVSQVAGALDAVHSVAGLVHRDVKPANVLLRQVEGRDHAYLTDFGVAKPSEAADQLTRTGWVVGTDGYLSPEQIRGQKPGPRSDLYSLGCLFFEAITGQPPFRAENQMALRWAHANDPRPAVSAVVPELDRRYDQFIAVALAIDPERRFASGRDFATALRAAYEETNPDESIAAPHAPTAVGPPTPMPPPVNTPPPAYGYATPPPAGAHSGRSGSPLALIVLGLVALAGIAVGALAATGVFSHTSTAQTISAVTGRRTSTTHTSTATRVSSSVSAATTTVTSNVPSPPVAAAPPTPSGTSSCTSNLWVGPNTSCGFAQNVQQAYDNTTGGSQIVTAFSPATGNTYTIDCTGGSPHVCTGGTTNNASVYFTAGPSGAGAPSPTTTASGNTGTPTGLHACDPNISANADTSCPFAENVFKAYATDYQTNGEQSNDTVTAYSPATNQSYTVDCTTNGVTVDCAGTTGNFVTFPMHAVEVY
jgi:serine/threonine protein kinase